jgi:hypothetical protein
MNDALIGAALAFELTRTHVNSSRPDAPVMRDPGPRSGHRVRVHAASGLRRLASALEPCEPAGTALRT